MCLVGGGQEINTGEAGISEWIKALNEKFTHWKIYISDKLTEAEYAEGQINALLANNDKVTYSSELHLGVSLRSFRAENLSAFVHSLLTFDPDASMWYDTIKERYPILLTRNMDKARAWLRKNTRGSQRSGVLVSKAAARFKPLAVIFSSKATKTLSTGFWRIKMISGHPTFSKTLQPRFRSKASNWIIHVSFGMLI